MLELESSISGNLRNFLGGGLGLGSGPGSLKIYYSRTVVTYEMEFFVTLAVSWNLVTK